MPTLITMYSDTLNEIISMAIEMSVAAQGAFSDANRERIIRYALKEGENPDEVMAVVKVRMKEAIKQDLERLRIERMEEKKRRDEMRRIQREKEKHEEDFQGGDTEQDDCQEDEGDSGDYQEDYSDGY